MRFALSDEQRQFAASLHELLSRSVKWADLADIGVTALAVPESQGGLGADAVDLVVAFEELGHHAIPGPITESIAVVPALLGGRECVTVLERHYALTVPQLLASGDLVATLAFPPHVPYALDADTADLVLAIAGDSIWVAEPIGPALSSVDPSRRLFATKPVSRLASGLDVAPAFNLGVLATAAQLLGAGRAMLELTVGYAKQRSQFGRPIGQFQAVKHQLADVLVALELARPLLHGAALSLAARDVSAAKIAASLAADRAAKAALQVHGAIGYTQEYELSRWLTKVRALRCTWGGLSVHRATVLT
jgi:alkylation response protein AidB-like acyl-CoA dehydrogenase